LGTIAVAAIAAAVALVAPKFLSPPTQKDSASAPADTRSPAAELQASALGGSMRPDQRQAIASLVARGKELLRDGDFSSARLILQRAADAGEADAALTLGSTYDPSILAQLGIRSQVANVDLARTWYEKAQVFGSAEASSRLKTLRNR
jgi:TPR repeat protein